MALFADAPRDLDHTNLAQTFVKALIAHRLLTHMPDIGVWGMELSRIRAPLQRITKVLQWYVSNLTKPFLPRASTARAFRVKFEEIEAAMTAQTQLPVAVTLMARRASERLSSDFTWPIEIQAELPNIVQRSMSKFRAFTERVRVYEPAQSQTRESLFLAHIIEGKLVPSFVEYEWMAYWGGKLSWLGAENRHYSGPLSALDFDAASETFLASFWRSWASEWCHQPCAFDRLLCAVLER